MASFSFSPLLLLITSVLFVVSFVLPGSLSAPTPQKVMKATYEQTKQFWSTHNCTFPQAVASDTTPEFSLKACSGADQLLFASRNDNFGVRLCYLFFEVSELLCDPSVTTTEKESLQMDVLLQMVNNSRWHACNEVKRLRMIDSKLSDALSFIVTNEDACHILCEEDKNFSPVCKLMVAALSSYITQSRSNDASGKSEKDENHEEETGNLETRHPLSDLTKTTLPTAVPKQQPKDVIKNTDPKEPTGNGIGSDAGSLHTVNKGSTVSPQREKEHTRGGEQDDKGGKATVTDSSVLKPQPTERGKVGIESPTRGKLPQPDEQTNDSSTKRYSLSDVSDEKKNGRSRPTSAANNLSVTFSDKHKDDVPDQKTETHFTHVVKSTTVKVEEQVSVSPLKEKVSQSIPTQGKNSSTASPVGQNEILALATQGKGTSTITTLPMNENKTQGTAHQTTSVKAQPSSQNRTGPGNDSGNQEYFTPPPISLPTETNSQTGKKITIMTETSTLKENGNDGKDSKEKDDNVPSPSEGGRETKTPPQNMNSTHKSRGEEESQKPVTPSLESKLKSTSRPTDAAGVLNPDNHIIGSNTHPSQDKTSVQKNGPGESKEQQVYSTNISSFEEEPAPSGHFMLYFVIGLLVCISGYIVFHNKQKILAYIVEGQRQGNRKRGGSSSGSTVKYSKLHSSAEEVMPSLDRSVTSKNYIY